MSIYVGNNEFFGSKRGAKTAAARRGDNREGSEIIDTSEGFCLLVLGEGTEESSYDVIHGGQLASTFTGKRWMDCNS